MPLALLAWSIFILVRFATTARGGVSPADGVRIGAAGISLVWLSYYANRPAIENLSSFGILYAIPAADAARRLMLSVRRRRLLDVSTVSAFVLTAIVTVPSVGQFIRFNSQKAAAFRSAAGSLTWISPRLAQPAGTVEISGVILRDDAASELTMKSRSLAGISDGRPLIFLTPHSYMIPKLSGVYPQLPAGDLFGESSNRTDYDRLVNYIKTAGARSIYVDPSGRDAAVHGSHPYFAFYAMLLRDIGTEYRANGSMDGWEIWIRQSGGGGGAVIGEQAPTSSPPSVLKVR
jgi:hypothetical protein